MGFNLPGIVNVNKQTPRRPFFSPENTVVPKGHFTVYVGETEKKRYVVPISYLKNPSFQDLLSQAEEEFGFDHPTGVEAVQFQDAEINFQFFLHKIMGFRLPRIVQAKKLLRQSSFTLSQSYTDVPKGHLAVYVGESERKRFIIPVSFLNHSSFQDMLRQAEEEFGFDHPMGGLTIPCREEIFTDLISQLRWPERWNR
ncbi:hypothetical protein EZV62_011691 [Acer yangbiense]|uniref:Uncharacterized protein n=1 Tax=Acer yangbiense TaxID=1000413 RepID=A0A5C7I621_9ROSI|nr:hypothetical protein EZV62_011691 [Acer yangbiense]